MHHPGPPRFVATGEAVELAPRDPDPSETYSWRLVEQPADSTVELGGDPVESLVPDAPGTYVARLTAPDGDHDLTIRAFPGELAPSVGAGGSGVSGRVSGSGPGFSGGQSGSGMPTSGSATGGSADGSGGRPTVTLSATVTDDEVVVHADPEPNPESAEAAADLTVEFLIDDRDDLDRSAVTISDRDLVVPLDRLPDRLRVYAVAVGETGYSVPDAIELGPGGEAVATDGGTEAQAESAPATLARDVRADRPYDPPKWAEDVVIYEIYVRTFADGEGEAFDAITDRLDYIDSLGVDVIWLTPVLQNDHAPHGYNITDFFSIASDLGTRSDYEAFIDAAHERDIKVLFDLICNHSARAHPHFQAAVSDPDSEYRDWYEWRTDTEPETYFDWEYIANFNFDHLPVRRHLLDAVDEWAPLVDGFRCDMAWAVPDNFWREVHDRLKGRDSEFLLLDETIPYIPDFQAGLFDTHFDSTTYAALRRVGRGDAPATDVLDAIDQRAEAGFPSYAGFMLYAENHDETRYLVECGRAAAEAALGALFTLPGAPLVYAGQEFGQRGMRDDLVWDHADEELREHVETLAHARHDVPALAGEAGVERVDHEVHDGDADRVVAYRRDPPAGESVVVVLNFGEDPVTVGIDAVRDATDALSGDVAADEDGLVVDSVAVFPAVEAARSE